MKYAIALLVCILPVLLAAQIGIKAGPNFANITKASSIDASTRTGYHMGVFYGGGKGLLGSRTELLYSRQGYNFTTNTNSGSVDLDYILVPQFLAINITGLVQIHAGAQLSYLINAKVDSSFQTGMPVADKAIDLFNRIDYGIGGGVEIHPLKMLVAGVRVNFGLGKLFKIPQPGQEYSFIPNINAKNNLFQLYAGLRFGGG